ncbi:MAG: glycosyltransferase [Phycisphaerae bacterium]|nr:glycosyltransferase [Phycisphaerae bacterium]
MDSGSLNIVIAGLSITSSWGNGHATTWRALIRRLEEVGHQVTFLERDLPWYASNRDMPEPPFCRTVLYDSVEQLRRNCAGLVKAADFVIIGSYVREGVQVGRWLLTTAEGPVGFYDIDTPVTLSKLARGDYQYIEPSLIPEYDCYLSFTGGKTLDVLEEQYGSPMARALYCSVDVAKYFPEEDAVCEYDLGYLGTYSDDRQQTLDELLIEPARRLAEWKCIVAGAQYPEGIDWPANIRRLDHVPPEKHRAFYNAQRFTLNVTRQDMITAGYSPSVRLFEAAACGVPVISDYWPGLETFFEPGKEILIARSHTDTIRCLCEISEKKRRRIGALARRRVLREHSSTLRAQQLVTMMRAVIKGKASQGQRLVETAV